MIFRKAVSVIVAAAAMVASAMPVMANETGKEEETNMPVYLDTSRSFEERAADLVSRMTLEEKVAQLGYQAPAIDRLGVSKYNYWMECLHGVARQGKATNYPASLSLSNTWNRELIYQIADETSTEARAKNSRYNLSYYTPTINMARDPRWGRNEESYGEDPYLTGQLGAQFVKGMQGNDEKYTKIIATIKHFAANNNEKNRRGGSSYMTEFNFRNYYTKVFQNVTEQVMPCSVMSSYNATSISRNGDYIYNFRPSSSNPYLLTELLRRNWGFDGYVTTDCGAGNDLASVPQYKQGALESTDLPTEAYVAEALKSGMDLECNLSGGNTSTAYGVKSVENGYMTEEQLETTIYHLFLQRFRTGEFDDTNVYRGYTKDNDLETDAHIATAEKAAEESWVLLKNDDNTLPLNSDVKKVAVVGNLADKLVLGDYTGTPEKTVTPIDGIKSELGEKVEVKHVGAVAADEKLFNVKSIKLVNSKDQETTLNLSLVEIISGMEKSTDGKLINITPQARAVIRNVNFEDIKSVKVEMATGTMWGGSLNIAYGEGGPTVASVSSQETADENTYVACSGDYTGADGGYNGTVDMYISASAMEKAFSIKSFKTDLDAADVIIAYAGTIPKQAGFGDADSSESKDRGSINLPAHQSHVQAICDAYPGKTIVVMSTVGQINVEPFMSNCKAILWTSYNGQTQGTALGKILKGEANPSGRLTTTWYQNADVEKLELSNNTDTKIGDITGKFTNYNIQPEGAKPGNTYMYYNNTPVYPFGYGLSYTNFEYSDMTLDKASVAANGTVSVSVKVQNTGTVKGAEVVQLYVSHPQGGENTPKKQLKDFDKITLEPNESKTVTFELSIKDLYLFDEAAQKDIVPNGEYTIYAGKNADDTSNSAKLTVTGTLDSKLKTVKAMPDGITVYGLTDADGTNLKGKTQIKANLSAIMTDETWVDLENAQDAPEIPDPEPGDVPEGYTASMAYENGKLAVKSTVAQTADIIHVTYNGKTLKSVDILKEKQLTSDKNAVFTLDAAPGDKIMLWNSVSGTESMKPIAKAVDVTVSESDDTVAEGITVSYTSSDPDIAKVDKDGTVTSGTKEGTAIITATVNIDGVRKSDRFPVVNSLVTRPSAEEIAAAKAELEETYKAYPQTAYSPEDYDELTKLYNDAVSYCENDAANDSKEALDAVVSAAKDAMAGVTPDKLQIAYTISSENSNILVNGVIDYREGGIEPYNGATGTITNANPKTGVKLLAKNGTDTVANVLWSLKKVDASVRQVAEIDTKTGELTIYGNGLVEITAADMTNLKCAKQVVYINTQIEGEYADAANGANLADAQKNTSNGLDVGSSGKSWVEYKGVKLSMLESVILRYSSKSSDCTVNISLAQNTNADKLLASDTVTATGAWSTWADKELTINQDVIEKAELDEYGCATIYIQTNGANLDYFKLIYTEYNDEQPYVIGKITNKQGGKMNVELKHRGSAAASDVKLVAEVLNSDGSVKSTQETKVSGSGEYEIATGAADGENVKLTVRDGNRDLSASVEQTYRTPGESKIVAYYRDADGAPYESFVGAGAGELKGPINGIYSYGTLSDSTRKGTYVYTDFNGKTYTYTFDKVWKTSGKGTLTNENLFFTPTSACKVTVVFDGNGGADREVTIYQSDSKTVVGKSGTGKSDSSVSLDNITDTTKPVYVYGSNGTTNISGIIVEYYNMGGDSISLNAAKNNADEPLQTVDWNGSEIELTKNAATGETKLWSVMAGGKAEIATNQFYSAPNGYPTSYEEYHFKINCLGVYKDRLFAGCDGGFVMMLTDCIKCYQLKKPVGFDIKEMNISNGKMTVSDDEQTQTLTMASIGADSIEMENAQVMIDSGRAVLVDVRDASDYEEKRYSPSINIPIDLLETKLPDMIDDPDATIIFVCYSGVRSAKAIETAKKLGYINTYNLGGIDKLL